MLIIACSRQLRISPGGGVLGVDMLAALEMARSLGYDMKEMAILLPWAELGLVNALNKE